LFWFVFVISNALIPGFAETQQQFVYVLELAEANGKNSDQLISQAWDYSLAAAQAINLEPEPAEAEAEATMAEARMTQNYQNIQFGETAPSPETNLLEDGIVKFCTKDFWEMSP